MRLHEDRRRAHKGLVGDFIAGDEITNQTCYYKLLAYWKPCLLFGMISLLNVNGNPNHNQFRTRR
jgi:hypothetical protein